MRCRTSSYGRVHGQAGISILEILVVLFLIGLMLLIWIPFSLKQFSRMRIEGYATQVASLMQSTRGRAIRDNQDRSVAWFDVDGDGTIDSISGFSGIGANVTTQVSLSFEERGLKRVLDTDPEPCLDRDNDAVDDYKKGPLVYNGTGTADDFVAFCFQDPSGNLMQVAVDTPGGPPKIRKHVPSGEFVTERWKWEWY